MKRISALGLALILTLSALAAASASASLPAKAILRKNAQLRTEPSKNSASKMILMQGTELMVTEILGGWLRVKYGSNTGYIFGDLIIADPNIDPGFMNGGDRKALKLGMSGEQVLDLQTKLVELGYLFEMPDGYFGERTKHAVEDFQTACRLKVDGVAGRDTFAMLDRLRAEAEGAGALPSQNTEAQPSESTEAQPLGDAETAPPAEEPVA